jgi:glucosamine--fructose-6-phosphate aminotransferase (isomerizing)
MCGIVAYLGPKSAQPVLLESLKRLEYRGYDSAGAAVVDGGALKVARSVGRVSALEQTIDEVGGLPGCLGIAHTRWATHGSPTEANAHPHVDSDQRIALVHNGIIENYAALRTYLEGKGRSFTSETDTEVLAQLIGQLRSEGLDLETAVQAALREVTGAYAIAVISADDPQTLVVARKGSPLLIGVSSNAYVAASDASAIIAHTSQVIALEDYQVAKLTIVDGQPELRTTTIDNVPVSTTVQDLEMSLDEIELGGYEHYMLKEIMEQPDALRNTLRGRIDLRDGRVVLGGLNDRARDLVRAKRFVLTAQGTAWHAGHDRRVPAGRPGEGPHRVRVRQRVPLPQPDRRGRHRRHRHQPVGRDRRHARSTARSEGPRGLALGVVNVVGSTMPARPTRACTCTWARRSASRQHQGVHRVR